MGEASQANPRAVGGYGTLRTLQRTLHGGLFRGKRCLIANFGMSKRRRLKEGTIPTIFERMSAERASTSSKRPCDLDTPTAPPKRPCRAVEKRYRVTVSNCTCCHTSISILMTVCLQVLKIILLQIVEELFSQPSTSAAVTVLAKPKLTLPPTNSPSLVIALQRTMCAKL